jgi:hypothetical protein
MGSLPASFRREIREESGIYAAVKKLGLTQSLDPR